MFRVTEASSSWIAWSFCSSVTVRQLTGRNIAEDLNVRASAIVSCCDVSCFEVKRVSSATSRDLRRDLNRVTVHYVGYLLTVA
jgi:hypothetical protein